jgi:HSP20 family protein
VQLRSLINDFFNARPAGSSENRLPLANIHEQDDSLLIRILAPGARIEDIDLNIMGDVLTINLKREDTRCAACRIRNERLFGNFSRSIRLPYRVNHEKTSASVTNGVLEIRLEKSEEAKPRKIAIS